MRAAWSPLGLALLAMGVGNPIANSNISIYIELWSDPEVSCSSRKTNHAGGLECMHAYDAVYQRMCGSILLLLFPTY